MVQTLTVPTTYSVECNNCGKEFDLLAAKWCGCGARVDRPSKVCPYCMQCICLHPDYDNEALWNNAPRYMRRHGFDRLFYLYL